MKINTLRRRPAPGCLALALLLGGAGACAPNGAPVPGPRSEMALRTSHQCAAEPPVGSVTAAAQIVDPGGLASGLRAVLSDAGRDDAEVVMTLAFQADGLNVERSVLAHDLAPALTDTVQKLVFANLRRAPEAPGAWGIRLRIQAGPELRLALEPREYCPPRPRDPQLEGAIAQFTGSGVRYRQGQRERVVLLQVQVHPAGYVESARILRGGPSGGTLERELADFARRFSFVPASIDGVPVRGTVAFPVRVPA